MRNQARTCAGQVRQHDDRQAVIWKSRDKASETLPCAAVFNYFVPIHLGNALSESVAGRIWMAIAQRKHRPDPVAAGLLLQTRPIQRFVPLREVQYVVVKRSICRRLK